MSIADNENDLSEGLLPPVADGSSGENSERGEEISSTRRNKDVDELRGGIFSLKPSLALALPSLLIGALAIVSFAPIFPGILERWFTACDLDHDPDCKPNYGASQREAGIYDSIQNLLGFLVVAQLGRLSDAYGRKVILILSSITLWLPFLSLILTNEGSAAAYYTVTIIGGAIGGGGKANLGTVWAAYIADISSDEDRNLNFGFLAAAFGLSLLCQPLVGWLTRSLSTHTVLCLFLSMGVINTLYIIFILPESLAPHNRNVFTAAKLNPLASLSLIQSSRLLALICLVTFLYSMPELGVQEIALLYLNDVYKLEGDEAKEFNSVLFFFTGFSLSITQLAFVRLMTWLNTPTYRMILIAQVANLIHLIVFASLSVLPIWAPLVNALFPGIITITNVAVNVMISKRMGRGEVGYAMGTLGAVTGICGVCGPLLYSQLFALFDKIQMPYIPFIIGAAFVSVGLAVVAGPLRREERKPTVLVPFSHSRMIHSMEYGGESDEPDEERAS